MAFFNTWLWNKIPYAIRKRDSYKDLSGKGIMERTLEAYGEELDENFMPFLNNFIDLFSIETMPTKFLTTKASDLGGLPTLNNDPIVFRKLLLLATQIFKIKGTEKSYQLIFNLLGYDVKIWDIEPNKKAFYDDKVSRYDDATYDGDYQWYSDFYVLITPIGLEPEDFNTFTITDDLINYAQQIVNLLTPYDCQYKGLIAKAKLNDTTSLTITQS